MGGIVQFYCNTDFDLKTISSKQNSPLERHENPPVSLKSPLWVINHQLRLVIYCISISNYVRLVYDKDKINKMIGSRPPIRYKNLYSFCCDIFRQRVRNVFNINESSTINFVSSYTVRISISNHVQVMYEKDKINKKSGSKPPNR